MSTHTSLPEGGTAGRQCRFLQSRPFYCCRVGPFRVPPCCGFVLGPVVLELLDIQASCCDSPAIRQLWPPSPLPPPAWTSDNVLSTLVLLWRNGCWRADGCLAPVTAVDHALLGNEPPVSRLVEASSMGAVMAFGHGRGRSVSIGISAGAPLNILAWAIMLLIEDDLSACAVVGPVALLTGDQRLGMSWPARKPTSWHLQSSLAPWKWLHVWCARFFTV